MNFLSQQDVHDIIEEMGMPCRDSKALLNDLNYWIVERGYLSDKKPHNANQQKKKQKEISQKNKALHNSRLGCLKGALNTIIFRSEKISFFKQAGIEEQKIKHAKEILEALIKLELESVTYVPMNLKDFEEKEYPEERHSPITMFKSIILPTLYEKYFGNFKNHVSPDHQKISSGIQFIQLVLKKSANLHVEAAAISKACKRQKAKKGH